MYSKFDFYNLSRSSVSAKETKLQKYLRLKNEHIMEKCFDIKRKNLFVENSKEPLQQQLVETKQEKLPVQSSAEENIILLTAKEEDEKVLLQADNCQQQPIANESGTFSKSDEIQMPTSPKAPKKQFVSTAKMSSSSKQNFNSKAFKRNNTPIGSCSVSDWKSPFKSIITKGARTRPQSSEFAYDLSHDELKFAGNFRSPMKPPPESERQLLKQGQRRDYLMQRYEHSPVVKYNFPEATSWRIGWLQQ